ncbi:Modification methylase DpnIIB [subsurface metagenome]
MIPLQDAEQQLILGDSMRIMDGLKMKFDCLFIDPPYFDWADGKTKKPDHNKLSILAYELLKPNGCIFLCGTQPQMANDWHYWARFFKLNFELIAHKLHSVPPLSKKRPILTHENIWCLWRKKDSLKNVKIDISKVAKGRGKTVRIHKKGSMRTRYGDSWQEWKVDVGYPKSVITVPRISSHSKEYEGHPAQKPLKITRLIIKMSTDEGDWILDPFSGVGTTLMIAKELSRNCLGIEINKEYIRLTKRRLQRVKELKKLKSWME